MAQLISGTYQLNDDEAMTWLNTATGTSFDASNHEISSVKVTLDENGERSLLVVVGPKA
jgi:hypothetical protein